MTAPEGFRPEDSALWEIWPELAARTRPGDLVALEPTPDDGFSPKLDLLRRLGCPTVVRRMRDAS